MYHCRLGHIEFAHLRWLARRNKLPVNNPTDVSNFDKVVCAACEFSRSSKRHDGAGKTNIRKDKKSEINKRGFPMTKNISISLSV